MRKEQESYFRNDAGSYSVKQQPRSAKKVQLRDFTKTTAGDSYLLETKVEKRVAFTE